MVRLEILDIATFNDGTCFWFHAWFHDQLDGQSWRILAWITQGWGFPGPLRFKHVVLFWDSATHPKMNMKATSGSSFHFHDSKCWAYMKRFETTISSQNLPFHLVGFEHLPPIFDATCSSCSYWLNTSQFWVISYPSANDGGVWQIDHIWGTHIMMRLTTSAWRERKWKTNGYCKNFAVMSYIRAAAGIINGYKNIINIATDIYLEHHFPKYLNLFLEH